ncbi:DNA-3-methyladenine glycosylase I [Loigolactobacillus bifermentans]|jgi:DNA-3-methyladenine glycosylase I|uniref:Dna-3-methyladenine glycosylase n=1 Tax=Loigolactobacillus bifermentans DSM 20003 TaxID=1423726 RepID=A0A0R1GN89_9LACO|nr:DNA-3-methyladenine glycosylase I [Loigolactobacillus bifermentans]KRK32794.1 dna-3-methyladenine glycosylase [Loigolactobacillus bifermentans DSM 20003]QGG59449.1 DNA-3-methyladenine glycosylase I [Loigolactobacillus bifermentans]
MQRCDWAEHADSLMTAYHDQEWGVPTTDERKTFELLTLELMQAGLSWQTVLNKRDHFRQAFDNFEVTKIARYDDQAVQRLRHDAGIIRNRLKIAAVIHNAQVLVAWHQQGQTLNDWLWAYVAYQPIVHRYATMAEMPTQTPLAQQISKDLKKADFRFVGPTIIQSLLQALGIFDDHLAGCQVHHIQ